MGNSKDASEQPTSPQTADYGEVEMRILAHTDNTSLFRDLRELEEIKKLDDQSERLRRKALLYQKMYGIK